jgi:hypothetical protein
MIGGDPIATLGEQQRAALELHRAPNPSDQDQVVAAAKLGLPLAFEKSRDTVEDRRAVSSPRP